MANSVALRATTYSGDNNCCSVDCAISCNIKRCYSVGLMFWFITRELLRVGGDLVRADLFAENNQTWPDLFFYRDRNEILIGKAKKKVEKRERALQEQEEFDGDGISVDDQGGVVQHNVGDGWQNDTPIEHASA